jgi:L-fuculose-phosphate aldolase
MSPKPLASKTRRDKARSEKVLNEKTLRKALVETAKAMSARGLSPGRSGNVSCRLNDGMLITPSGLAYDELKPADIVQVEADGSVPRGQRCPSTEWHFHLAIYRARTDRHAVVHTHSLHATVLACARRNIPAFHYMVAVAGGLDIPLVPYATFGSEELARHVADGLRARDACLMAHHGQVAIGTSLERALELAFEVEVLAEQYVKVLTLGRPDILDEEEMTRVLEKFKGYGAASQT